MKKTLFLTMVLGTVGICAERDDVFVPQSTLTIKEGEEATLTTAVDESNYVTSTSGTATTVADGGC